MAAPILKKFVARSIPETFTDSVVYDDNENILRAEKRNLVQHWRSEMFNLTESSTHKFVKAVIIEGKLAVFKHLLAGGFQMHLGDLIYIACQYGHLALVREIMDTRRVEVDKVTKYGWKPLDIAVVNGRTEVVTLLVKTYHANINIGRQYSPLENAIEGGHLDTVKEMIQLGAQKAGKVDYLKSSARLVVNQGELVNPGNEYQQISDHLRMSRLSV